MWEDNNRIILGTRPDMMYLLAVFLTNVHNCMEPNEIGRRRLTVSVPVQQSMSNRLTMAEAAEEVAAALLGIRCRVV